MDKIKSLSMILLIISCTACAPMRLPEAETPDIDLKKLHDKNKKYGIVVSRAIYFKTKELAREFCSRGKSSKDLTIRNELGINIAPHILNQSSSECPWRFISRRTYITGKKLDQKLFMYKQANFFAGLVSAILKPEYLYGVSMLPEGKYYIPLIGHTEYNGTSISTFTQTSKNGENARYFQVEGGKINYIGDLYLTSLYFVKSDGFFSNSSTYEGTFITCNRYQDAKNFIKEFYPEIKLPFVKNMIECCEPMNADMRCSEKEKRR